MRLAEQAWALALGAAVLVVLLVAAGYWIGRLRRKGSRRHRPARHKPSRSLTAMAKRKTKSR